jgi:hypothetical protein
MAVDMTAIVIKIAAHICWLGWVVGLMVVPHIL